MALLAEFGEYEERVHGRAAYFHVEHYLSVAAQRWLAGSDAAAAASSLERLHQRAAGAAGEARRRRRAEAEFVQRVGRSDAYGFHSVHAIEVDILDGSSFISGLV